MRIKEVAIRRYGPLPDMGRMPLGDFSLFFGKNEDGKTLTIDAVVRILFKTGRRHFERIDRVDEEPEGYLIMVDDNGNEIKLPEKGDLASIAGLTASEFRNIFIIRNSDLSIIPEAEFYREVTDRLTGLRTEEIDRIKSELQGLGKLTRRDSSASLRDIRGEKLSSRVGRARELTERIGTLSEETIRKSLGKIEENSLEISQKIDETNQALARLEDARKRKKYEECNHALEKLRTSLAAIKELQNYNADDEQQWTSSERDIEGWMQDREKLREALAKNSEQFEIKKQGLGEKSLRLQALEGRKRILDEKVRPEARDYEMKSGELARRRAKNTFLAVAAMISALLFAISLVGIIFNPSLPLYVLAAVFAGCAVVFGISWFLFVKEKAWLAGMFERIRLSAARFELGADSIEGIMSNIQKSAEDYSSAKNEVDQLKTEVALLELAIADLTGTKIPDVDGKVGEARELIGNMIRVSGVGTLDEYRQRLQSRHDNQNWVDTYRRVLESQLGRKGETLDENLSAWAQETTRLAQFKDSAIDIEYDEVIVSTLKEERESLLAEQHEWDDSITSLRDKLGEIEREANDILQPEGDHLHCSTSVDLEAISSRLQGFVDRIESDMENAILAMRIFEELEAEEEQRVSFLFGEDSLVSKYFGEITGGIYQQVEFIPEEKSIRVHLKDGTTLDADKLSGGTYDQLYLSIRLALGEKLLAGDKGFFIMDDPFVKADIARLKRQIEMLKGISESGWQIIYFTAKDEVKEVLKQDIETDKVNYIEVQGIFS